MSHNRMPKPPRGQSPRNMVMKLNAASGPKAFHQIGSSGSPWESPAWLISAPADFSAFLEERVSISDRTPQTKKQAQKAFFVLTNELRIRSRMTSSSKSPASFAKTDLRRTELLYSNIPKPLETITTADISLCQRKGRPVRTALFGIEATGELVNFSTCRPCR